jgi:hypothetical protein
VKRGWQINAGQILKIAMQLQDVNLKDPAILKEQLMGVDAVYMMVLINAIANSKESVTNEWIMTKIDELFED